MKISIITPTYNSEATLEDTLKSVLSQTHTDIEYIIIDGKSADRTLEIIKSYQTKANIKLLSESDQGLYDAMNKGIKMASGDIVGILNSDDFYSSSDVLSKIAACFIEQPGLDACYADLEFVDGTDTKKIVRTWKAGRFDENKLDNGWIIPHPTFFVKKKIYEKFGNFDLNFKIAADYELLLRLLKVHKINVGYIPEIIVNMRTGGVSGKNLSQRVKGWGELKLAWRVNNLKLPRLFVARRILSKLNQFF